MAGTGGAREGAGRKPGALITLAMKTMVEDLRSYHPKARERLMKLIDSEDEDIALRALELYYDRCYGKPREDITLRGADTPAQETVHLKLYELKKALELAELPFSHLVARDMKLIEQPQQKTNGEAQELQTP